MRPQSAPGVELHAVKGRDRRLQQQLPASQGLKHDGHWGRMAPSPGRGRPGIIQQPKKGLWAQDIVPSADFRKARAHAPSIRYFSPMTGDRYF